MEMWVSSILWPVEASRPSFSPQNLIFSLFIFPIILAGEVLTVVNIIVWLNHTFPLLCCSRYQYYISRQLFSSVPDSEICSINMTVEASTFLEGLSCVVLCSLIKQLDLGFTLMWIIVQFPESIFWKCHEDVLHVFGDIKYWITVLCHFPVPVLSHTHSPWSDLCFSHHHEKLST